MTFHTTDGHRPVAPTWRGLPVPLTRKAIGDEIERLIELLDVAEGDPDIEENGDERDASFPTMMLDPSWRLHPHEDSEDSDDDCGIDDVPHDDGFVGREAIDCEPSLGWTEEINQERRTSSNANLLDMHDGEEDGGDMPEGDGEFVGGSVWGPPA